MGVMTILFGLGLFLALLWNFAVYALPAYVGFSVGWWALNHGAGIGCVVVGPVAGVAVFLAAHVAVTSSNAALRWFVTALFVLPAAYAGYNIVLQLSELGSSSEPWRTSFAAIGAVVVGATALMKLTSSTEWLQRH